MSHLDVKLEIIGKGSLLIFLLLTEVTYFIVARNKKSSLVREDARLRDVDVKIARSHLNRRRRGRI